MIGTREQAKRVKRGVGGKAFPHDYNWTCAECGGENRAFEETCGYCEHEVSMQAGFSIGGTRVA